MINVCRGGSRLKFSLWAWFGLEFYPITRLLLQSGWANHILLETRTSSNWERLLISPLNMWNIWLVQLIGAEKNPTGNPSCRRYTVPQSKDRLLQKRLRVIWWKFFFFLINSPEQTSLSEIFPNLPKQEPACAWMRGIKINDASSATFDFIR